MSKIRHTPQPHRPGAASWTFCGFVWGEHLFDYGVLFPLIFLSNGILKLWIAWLATHRLAEDRRSGALELLCCLPVSERSIWGSWLLHLKQRLLAPFTCLILAEAFLLALGTGFNGALFGESLMVWGVFLLLTIFLVADCYTLSWAGFRFSLNSSRASTALVKTIGSVLLIPGLLLLLTLPGWSGFIQIEDIAGMTVAWAAMGAMINIPVCAMAMDDLSHSFRDRIASRGAPEWDGRTARGSLSASGRRRRIPTPDALASLEA